MNDLKQFRMTKHATERALDMQIEPHEIRQCLLHPELVRDCKSHPGLTLYHCGRITCSVTADYTVVTILWRTNKEWRDDLHNRPAYEGRTYREQETA